MKILVSLLFFLCIQVFAFSQTKLMVRSGDKGLYIDHKVVAKDNFYSIGRRYNVAPKEIASYNKLDMNKGLSIDQVIRIPLSSANFSQTVNEGAAVYYKTSENESLSKLSNKFNNVPVDNLKYWNA